MSLENKHNTLYNQYSHKLSDIDQGGAVIAEYVWLDGTGLELRAKCRTLPYAINQIDQVPEWNFDGSSTYQATTTKSEIILKPVAVFRDPFRQGLNVLVLCECWAWKDQNYQELVPANTNFRNFANMIWESPEVASEEPWYGIEQEYTLLGSQTKFTTHPLGWPSNGYPGPQGPYYCSAGYSTNFGRIVSDMHYKACLYAGIKISGTNCEAMPG